MGQDRRHEVPHHITEIILESICDGVFTVDDEWRITSFNRAAEVITGIPREDAIEKFCWEIFRSNMCEIDCALRRTMQRGKSFIDTSTHIITFDFSDLGQIFLHGSPSQL
jgi:PAS domain S-box-containing protein